MIKCRKCKHPRLVHVNPFVFWNKGVGKCNACSCEKYKPEITFFNLSTMGFWIFYSIGWVFGILTLLRYDDLVLGIMFIIFGTMCGILFMILDTRNKLLNELAEQEK